MQVKSKLRGHQKSITGLAFSNSLNVLVSSGADAQVCYTVEIVVFSIFMNNPVVKIRVHAQEPPLLVVIIIYIYLI